MNCVGAQKFEDAPLYTKGISSQLILQIHQQKRRACHVLNSKLRFVWRGCVNGAGHQCNLAESTWSCFVNPARDFDGQTLGSKRCLLHE